MLLKILHLLINSLQLVISNFILNIKLFLLFSHTPISPPAIKNSLAVVCFEPKQPCQTPIPADKLLIQIYLFQKHKQLTKKNS